MRGLLIQIFSRLSWRISDERVARSLHRFSQVEADSAWQLLQAIDATNDPIAKARLFQNAVEEMHHSHLFEAEARRHARHPLPLDSPRRQRIIQDGPSALAEFEAFHYVGESDVYRHFHAYARAAPNARIRELFERIREDEGGHEQLAQEQLVSVAGSAALARRLIRAARRKRLWEAWERLSRGIGAVVTSIVLGVSYFVFAPLLARTSRQRLVGTGPIKSEGLAEGPGSIPAVSRGP